MSYFRDPYFLNEQILSREGDMGKSFGSCLQKNRRAWFRSQSHMKYFRVDLTKGEITPSRFENN
jgi:hypothetical protein